VWPEGEKVKTEGRESGKRGQGSEGSGIGKRPFPETANPDFLQGVSTGPLLQIPKSVRVSKIPVLKFYHESIKNRQNMKRDSHKGKQI
jgi:hypothetical protein